MKKKRMEKKIECKKNHSQLSCFMPSVFRIDKRLYFICL